MPTGKDPEVGLQLNTTGFVSSAKTAKSSIDAIANTQFGQLSKGIVNLTKDLGAGALTIGKGARNMVGGLMKGISGAFAGGGVAGMSGAIGGGLGMLIGGPMGAAAGAAMAMGAAKMFEASIGAAMEENQLNDKLKATFGAQNFDFLDETANKVKSAFGFEDEDAKKAMTMLGQMGMGAEQASNSMSMVADVARAKNLELADAAKLVGKVFQGNEVAARRLGIQIVKTGDPLKDQAALMDQIQGKFAGQAALAAKNLDPMVRIKMTMDDLMKTIGHALIPIVVPFLTWVSSTLNDIVNSDGFDSVMGSMVKGFKTAWSYAKSIGITLVQYGTTTWEVIKQLPQAIGKMWNSGKLMDPFIAMTGGALKTIWDAVVMLGGLIKTAVMDGIPMIVGFLGKAITDMLRSALGDKISDMLGLKDVSATFDEMMKGSGADLGKNAAQAFADFGGKAKSNFADMGEISKDMWGQGGGIDFGAAQAAGQQTAAWLMGSSGRQKDKVKEDTADLYGQTGKASQTIGMSAAGKQNALAKQRKAMNKAAANLNKKAGVTPATQQTVNVNLQSTERHNPILNTV